jgi:hypothetical protein
MFETDLLIMWCVSVDMGHDSFVHATCGYCVVSRLCLIFLRLQAFLQYLYAIMFMDLEFISSVRYCSLVVLLLTFPQNPKTHVEVRRSQQRGSTVHSPQLHTRFMSGRAKLHFC